jgi:aspartyl protease family protein
MSISPSSGTPPPSARHITARSSGLWPMFLVWLALFGAAYAAFHRWEAAQVNPNTAASMPSTGDEVTLQRNRSGHYVAEGMINGSRVTFMLDTGATQVALPMRTARSLGLQLGDAVQLRTANGDAVGYRTRLDRVRLGPIELRGVAAVATDGMDGEVVLLGMSFLKRVEFAQRGDRLTLRSTRPTDARTP